MNLTEFNEIVDRCTPHASAKEKDFLESVKSFLQRRGEVTIGQESWINSISEKYSLDFLAEAETWESAWSSEHRTEAIRIAYYYEANPPYYSNYVITIFSDPENFILSKREWDRFCENKYAKKIRKEYNSPQRFSAGDMVQIRKTNKILEANYSASGHAGLRYNRLANRVGFVLKTNAKPIIRAAKGSRIYQILLTGESAPIFAHEADLKLPRGIKK